jgi:hypothetical protein
MSLMMALSSCSPALRPVSAMALLPLAARYRGSAMPTMAFIGGVRISWLMLARNSLLAQLAASARLAGALDSTVCSVSRASTAFAGEVHHRPIVRWPLPVAHDIAAIEHVCIRPSALQSDTHPTTEGLPSPSRTASIEARVIPAAHLPRVNGPSTTRGQNRPRRDRRWPPEAMIPGARQGCDGPSPEDGVVWGRAETTSLALLSLAQRSPRRASAAWRSVIGRSRDCRCQDPATWSTSSQQRHPLLPIPVSPNAMVGVPSASVFITPPASLARRQGGRSPGE